LSSGTWSLLGLEIAAPIINVEARRANFTNEGGVCGTTRFLKNVMGMWILQRCRKSFADRGEEWAYDRLIEAAARTPAFRTLINPDDERFLSPACMVSAIEKFCDETEQQRPQTPGMFARTVMESLAFRYAMVLRDLERLSGRTIRRIRVVGGGCCNDLMSQFTADATGCQVVAGPVEATAIGNIVMQMIGSGAVKNLSDARACVERSWSTRTFAPGNTDAWQQQRTRFEELLCLKQ
jgi:rhamnulokinase